MNSLDTMRRLYAKMVTAGVTDPRIRLAFETVWREHFVGAGPWKLRTAAGYLDTDTDDPTVLYQDVLIALATDRGINNGQPSLHAKCLDAARPVDGDSVVHVGAGTGYCTAILAVLAGSRGRVHAYEMEQDLARRAQDNLAEFPAVTLHAHSGLDQDLPPADVIYVSAGATHVPSAWLDALKVGGRLVLPLTPNERAGFMLVVTRQSQSAYAARIFSPAVFIPCIGARDEAQSRALAAALDAKSTEDVRSLRRGDAPDHTAWCIGNGWWLSTAEPLGDASGGSA